jgi:hypothetical protein
MPSAKMELYVKKLIFFFFLQHVPQSGICVPEKRINIYFSELFFKKQKK